MREHGVNTTADLGSARDRMSFEASYPKMVAAARVAAVSRVRESLVDDVVAETLARAWARWERLASHPNLAGWSFRCAQYVCREHGRREVREPAVADLTPTMAAEVGFDGRVVDRERLAAALVALSERQRSVVVSRYVCDQDEATTAARLGITVANVGAAANEARRRLRGLLADRRPDHDTRQSGIRRAEISAQT